MKMHLLVSQMDPTGAANALLLSSDDEDEGEYAGDEVASAYTPPSTRTPADQHGTMSSTFSFLRPLGGEGSRIGSRSSIKRPRILCSCVLHSCALHS